jgi:hypothetical protein
MQPVEQACYREFELVSHSIAAHPGAPAPRGLVEPATRISGSDAYLFDGRPHPTRPPEQPPFDPDALAPGPPRRPALSQTLSAVQGSKAEASGHPPSLSPSVPLSSAAVLGPKIGIHRLSNLDLRLLREASDRERIAKGQAPATENPDNLMSAPDISDVSDISAAPPRAFDTPDISSPSATLGAGALTIEEPEIESSAASVTQSTSEPGLPPFIPLSLHPFIGPPDATLGASAPMIEEQDSESHDAQGPVVSSAPSVASPLAPAPSPLRVDNIMSTVDVVDIVDIRAAPPRAFDAARDSGKRERDHRSRLDERHHRPATLSGRPRPPPTSNRAAAHPRATYGPKRSTIVDRPADDRLRRRRERPFRPGCRLSESSPASRRSRRGARPRFSPVTFPISVRLFDVTAAVG